MPFEVVTSNRLERLSDALAKALEEPLASTLASEIIIVQSRGMERWLSLQLARKMGICANIRFPFPNAFLEEIIRRVFPDLPEHSAFEPETMTWRLMRLIPSCLDQPAFAPPRRYLQEPCGLLKRLQLAQRIADLFDQYLMFRPEMVLGWEHGKESHWQAELWRKLADGQEGMHRAALGKKLVALLREPSGQTFDLPDRVSVFGISALPQFHMQVLDALSNHAKVTLFLLNPCREYWGDIRPRTEQPVLPGQTDSEQISIDFAADASHFTEGNALLASMGKLGRDFFDLLEGGFHFTEEEFFEMPDGDSLLARLQGDILALRDRGTAPGSKTPRPIDSDDRSLRAHKCHSPRREIEALQDALLEMFSRDPSLEPGDVLVMAPDIEPYVPFVQSVFDLPRDDPKYLPYSIADRSHHHENQLVETFFAILDLHGSRFTAAQVLAILESPAAQAKFAVSPADIEIIFDWVRQARIRWGIDAADRARHGLPEIEQNTWRSGLERLLLGYALTSEEERIYQDRILPLDATEGHQAEALGKLAEFSDRLFRCARSMEEPKSPRAWSEFLGDLLEIFFDLNALPVEQSRALQETLFGLAQMQELSGFDEAVDLSVVKSALKTKMRREGFGFGFLTGGMTFCSMLPMRSIPARVICLIGMNHDAYPRTSRTLAFDLIARNPEKGDRSRRNDDRYLFLETLLSARETLYISYIGQSIKDNSDIPPSVLLSELLSYVEHNFDAPDEQNAADFICVKHHLQAFNPAYFAPDEQTRVFSYSRENRDAAVAMLDKRRPRPVFFPRLPLASAPRTFREVTLDDLRRFFCNPTQFLFNRRLEIYLQEEFADLPGEESFRLSGLDRYEVARALLQSETSSTDAEEARAARLLAGEAPHGGIGAIELEDLQANVRLFSEKLLDFTSAGELPALSFRRELDGFSLSGKIEPIYANELLVSRYASVRAKDFLRAWLSHLVLNILREPGLPRQSVLAGLEKLQNGVWKAWRFQPVEDAQARLADLLQIYWEGLTRPIHFFPESGKKLIELIAAKKERTRALKEAGKVWIGSQGAAYGQPGECEDPYFYRCFGCDEATLDNDFTQLAERVWQPLLESLKEIAP